MDDFKKLYDAVSSSFDIGSFDEFSSKMKTTDDRKRFYDAIQKNGYDIGDYNEYENRLKKKDGGEGFRTIAEKEEYDKFVNNLPDVPNNQYTEKQDVTKTIPLEAKSIEEVSFPEKKEVEKSLEDFNYRKEVESTASSKTQKRLFNIIEDKYESRNILSPSRKTYEYNKYIENGLSAKEAADKSGLIYKEEDNKAFVVLPLNEQELFDNEWKNAKRDYFKEKDEKEIDPFMKDFWRKLHSGAAQTTGQIYGALDIITGGMIPEFGLQAEWSDYQSKLWNEAITREQSDIKDKVLSGDMTGAVAQSVLSMAEQVPTLMSLALGNAAGYSKATLALIGSGSTAQKYRQLKDEDLPEFNKIFTSVLNGVNEVVFEKIGTMDILNRVSKTVKEAGEEAVKQSLKDMYSGQMHQIMSNLYGGVSNGMQEGISEWATQLSNNIVDKVMIDPNKELTDGVSDSFITGFLIGTGLSIPANVASTTEYIKDKLNSLPENFPETNKIIATELMVDRDKLKEEEKNTDEAFEVDNTEKINKLNEELKVLNSEVKEIDLQTIKQEEDAIQKQKTEEVPLGEQTGDSKGVRTEGAIQTEEKPVAQPKKMQENIIKDEIKPQETTEVTGVEKPVEETGKQEAKERGLKELGTKEYEPEKTSIEPVKEGKLKGMQGKAYGEDFVEYDVNYEGKKVGDITTQENNENIVVTKVELDKGKGIGIGKDIYRKTNNVASEKGKPLVSSDTTGEQAVRVWESLVKSGEAVKIKEGRYQMLPVQKINNTENKTKGSVDGKKIEPAKEVKANKTIAIKEVIKDKDIKEMEAGFLLNKYSREESVDEFEEGLSKSMQDKLEEKGYIEYDNNFKYKITDTGKELVKVIDARIQTRKNVKSGVDLFPETANIPELKLKESSEQPSAASETMSLEMVDPDITMDTFKEIALKSETPQEFIEKTRKIKNVQEVFSTDFMDKYGKDKDGNVISREKTAERFMNDVKKIEAEKVIDILDKEIGKTRKEKLTEKELEVKNRIAERLQKLSGSKFIEGTEKSNNLKEVYGVINDLAELGIIKLEQGIDHVITELKKYLPDSNIDNIKKDIEDNIYGEKQPQIDEIKEESTANERLFGFKKAFVPDELLNQIKVGGTTEQKVFERGMGLLSNGDIKQFGQSIIDNPRPLNADEIAAMVAYKVQLETESDSLYEQIEQARLEGDIDKADNIQLIYNANQKSIEKHDTANYLSGYQMGLAFRMRQLLSDTSYNLQTMIRKYKAVNNGEISIHMENKFKRIEKELKEANKKIAEYEKNKQISEDNELIQEIKNDIRKKGVKTRLKGKDLIAEGFEDLNKYFSSYAIGDERASLVTSLSKIGRGLIDLGLASINDVVDKIGVEIKKKFKNVNIEDYRSDIESQLKSEAGTPTINDDGSLNIPHDLIRDYVGNGVEDINDLVKAIKKDFNLEESERDIRDVITNYGKTSELTKEEIEVKIREIKRIGKLVSGLEDVYEKQQSPKRSGLQRDKVYDKERRMRQELNDAIKDLPISETESKKRWKTALDGVKTRLKNRITDLKNQIETGKKTEKKKGIEYDAEALELKEEADALQAILDEMTGNKKMSDEQRMRIAISNINKWEQEYQRRIDQKDFTSLNEKINLTSPEINAAKERLNDRKKEYQLLKDQLGVTAKEDLNKYKDALKKSTDRYEKRLKDKDFATKKKKDKPVDEESLVLESKREMAKHEFEVEYEKVKMANRSSTEKTIDILLDVYNIPKSLVATADFSAVLRQGLVLSVGHPKIATKAFNDMFGQGFSEQKHNEFLARVRVSPMYSLYRKSKLYVAEQSPKLSAKEEQFLSNLAHFIPIIGKSVKYKGKTVIPGLNVIQISERAYSAYLNTLRIQVFNQIAEPLLKKGYTYEKNKKAFDGIAEYVNTASGRSSLGRLETSSNVLNVIFHSARFAYSRLKLISPVYYAGLPKEVRKEALKNIMFTIGAVSTILTLYNTGQDDDDDKVELDPRSSDFMKLKKGRTRIDIWGGMQQPVVLLSRIFSGSYKSVNTGVITRIKDKTYNDVTYLSLLGRFVRSKFAPTPALALDVLGGGKDSMGEEITFNERAFSMAIPYYIQDAKEVYKDLGTTWGSAATVGTVFGLGAQYYEPTDMDKVIEPIIDKKETDNKSYFENVSIEELPVEDREFYEKYNTDSVPYYVAMESHLYKNMYKSKPLDSLSRKEKTQLNNAEKRMLLLSMKEDENKYSKDVLTIISGTNDNKIEKLVKYQEKNGNDKTKELIEYMDSWEMLSDDLYWKLYDQFDFMKEPENSNE